jgi:uncharacterized protein (DUF58 family)
MIAPDKRLLWLVAVLVLPGAVLATFVPGMQPTIFALILIVLVLLICDAISASRLLREIAVETPAYLSLVPGRVSNLAVAIAFPAHGQGKRWRVGLALPPEIVALEEDQWVQFPQKAEKVQVAFTCSAQTRGLFFLKIIALQRNSPFKFWTVQRHFPVQVEFRVFPNLRSEMKQAAALFLTRGDAGAHSLRQAGKGRDFEKLREFTPGDDLKEIHWKATAKRGRPITKVFQIERTQEVYIILDHSRLMARPLPSEMENSSEKKVQSFLDKSIASALLLALAAEEHGDLFGLITFSSQPGKFLKARNGSQHFQFCRNALYTLQAETVSPDFQELFSAIKLKLRRRALLVFFTCLDDPVISESFLKHVSMISEQHLVLVLMIQPAQVDFLFEGKTPEDVNGLYLELSGHVQREKLRALAKHLQRFGVSFFLVSDDRLATQCIREYLKVKREQLL